MLCRPRRLQSFSHWIVLVVTLLVPLVSHADLQNRMRFERISFEELELDGDLIGSVKSIAQDQLGFIWFGGENGLVKYDGHAFSLYQFQADNPNSLAANEVNDIKLDHDGILWVATHKGLSRYNYTSDDFTNFTTQYPPGLTLSHINVKKLKVGHDNRLIMATDNGLTILQPNRLETTHILPNIELDSRIQAVEVTQDDKILAAIFMGGLFEVSETKLSYTPFTYSQSNDQATSIKKDLITDITQDHLGRIWISNISSPLRRINADGSVVEFVPPASGSLDLNSAWGVFEDSQKRIWVYTDNTGMALYQEHTNQFTPIQQSVFNPHSLSSNQVRSVFEDNHGDIWVGTFTAGVNYHDRSKYPFQIYYTKPGLEDSLSDNGVLCVFQTKDGEIWVGTERGLNLFHPNSGTFTTYTLENTQDQMLSDAILSIEEQPDGQLLLGTTRAGVVRFNRNTGTFTPFRNTTETSNGTPDNFVWKIIYDKGSVWIGTLFAGFVQYDLEGNKLAQYTIDSLPDRGLLSNYTSHIVLDDRGIFWIGTLEGLTLFDPTRRRTHHLLRKHANSPLGQSIRITAITKTSDGYIWVAIHGHGIKIFDHERQLVREITYHDGINSVMINSLQEDQEGNVWAATHNGISRINHNNYSVTNFQKQHGIVTNNHNRDASLLDENGILYFGSSGGLTKFNPKDIIIEQNSAPIQFTELKVNNSSVQATNTSILNSTIQTTESITLNHTHSSISISFALLNYKSSKYNHYSHILEGFDSRWTLPSRSNKVTYTQLPPGQYTLKVRGKDSLNSWSPDEAKLAILVLPAPWKTWWAYTLYAFAAAALISWLIHQKRRQLELEHEQSLNQELLNIAKIKNTFLANTSHELRTPLNGIIGLAEYLRDYCSDNKIDNLGHQLNIISNSGKKLLNLINDVLDFSKFESNKLILKTEPTNISQCINEALTISRGDIANKNIQVLNNLKPLAPLVLIDPRRIQQVLLNIINNAIKHTDEGHIIIENSFDQDFMTISIKDTGTGVDEAELPYLFGLFNQKSSDYGQEQGGIGLGLAIAKQIITLHGGLITVESKEGLGSKFSFTIPIAKVDNRAAMVPLVLTLEDSDTANTPHSQNRTPPKTVAKNAERILIVDDDAVNRLVMAGILKDYYSIDEAENGLEAIERIKNDDTIALVLLDIMMPQLSGFETCKEIRKIKNKSELPIIFVTARNIDDDTLVGFESGGNDFIEKPVTKSKLLPRIQYAIQHIQKHV